MFQNHNGSLAKVNGMKSADLVQALFPTEEIQLTILDIGAVQGPADVVAYDSLLKRGFARVIGFEPDKVACENLNRKYGPPHKFYPFFVGNGQPATFYETNWGQTGSLYRPNKKLVSHFQNIHEIVTLKAEHLVQTRRIDEIADIGDVDFMKIDVQGAELDVFEGCERILESCVIVHTEVCFVQLYERQPLFGDIDVALRNRGFQFHTLTEISKRCFKPFVVNNDINRGLNQMLWADATYVKDWMKFDELGVVKLKRLAILAHEILRSYDLCFFALSCVDAKVQATYSKAYLEFLGINPSVTGIG